ncbi:hypothetical protein T265_00324 [Opisthorchis viverrini]|uniref:Uncharacterized protein n=1 Tax=Opisthorchis viverrini TaxID=6198 RepID=A0A075A3D1_OPIVI|nr:hypothetical protein T265_00324 [Opisthorchis viverrini]KER33881.1 hypothetical protein T265_00324 [Opisthorchis viverrini]
MEFSIYTEPDVCSPEHNASLLNPRAKDQREQHVRPVTYKSPAREGAAEHLGLTLRADSRLRR